jgi:hypothetical protein
MREVKGHRRAVTELTAPSCCWLSSWRGRVAFVERRTKPRERGGVAKVGPGEAPVRLRYSSSATSTAVVTAVGERRKARERRSRSNLFFLFASHFSVELSRSMKGRLEGDGDEKNEG